MGMKTKPFYSITDCSKLLGVQEHRIAYAHRISKLAEPKMRFAGKRVYSAADLQRVAKYFRVPVEGKD
jgi:DNA-binding transcriptional MerR regulator